MPSPDLGYADGLWAQDLEAQVRFYNPHVVSEGDWSYDLILRDDDSKPRIIFLVAHLGGDPYWRNYSRKGPDWTTLNEGVSGNIKTGEKASNVVRVRLTGHRVTFWVNGTAVSTNLDLGSDLVHGGYVAAAANFSKDHGKLLWSTEFDGSRGTNLD